VRDEHAAADLVQEVFFRAWRQRLRYEERDRAQSYLFAIADRAACDFLRRPRRVALADDLDPSDEADPATPLLRLEGAAMVRGGLSRLSEAQQRTLLLRFYGEMSFQEIAQTLECPLGTVLSHCHRGLERLRDVLAKELA
jgi:RNA polymerase sigma-70 factor (ECF subfamily)